ncbi:MAG: hypothetical protein JKP92_07465 [Alphaproteobacteria bacterium]|jgi:hypothetical protein|nr:hypothetical protein [Alphaproteobacteria bacterium]
MSRFVMLFLLPLLPALAALGHDAYIYTQVEGESDPFRFVALGWIVVTYLPEAHQAALSWLRADAPLWALEGYATVLAQPAALVGLALSGFFWAVGLLIWAVSTSMSAFARRRWRAAAAHKPMTVAQILGREAQEIKYKHH